MRVLKGLLLVLACLVIVPSAAFAQASLAGVVKDTSGAVLPGVTVEASSPVLIERSRTAVTDASGLYRIVDLRPGTYLVTFTLAGFTTFKRDGVELSGAFTATINADLKVGAIAETITVTGETPVVDVQNTRRETVIRADVIQAIPATRAYGSLLNAMPGVTVDTNGLATSPTMTFFTAHGGNTNEGRMSINGLTVAAAFNGGGVSSLVYNTTDLDEVTMLVSGGLGESETGGPAMNLVPRSGGNRFAGQAFFSSAGDWSRGDNIDDTLRNLPTPITKGPGIKSSYDASGSLGGPIKRDKVWFFGSYRKYETTTGVEGIGSNKFVGLASHWDYQRDDTIEPRNIQGRNIPSARVTAQLTARNRVTFQHEHQLRCEGSTLTTSGTGCRTRGADWIALGATTQSPESTTGYFQMPYDVTQATWTSPVTSKLLLEAGYSRFAYVHAGGPGQLPPDGIFNLIPVTEQLARDAHNANFTYRGLGSYSSNWGNPNSWRASASYITGAHAMKFGYQGSYLIADTNSIANDSQLTYRSSSPITGTAVVMNAFSYRLQQFQQADRTTVAAFYAQDTWTHNRLSVQGAIRYDNASSFSPAEHNGSAVTTPFNTAPITVVRTDGASYKDISPRVGLAYDVFGNGKTALKFNLGRYLAPATNDTNYTVNNPAQRVVTSVTNRSWSDTNGNFIVDCDINNPLGQNTGLAGSIVVPGGDQCGANTGAALNFGKPGTVAAATNPNVLTGWGKRPVDWQWGLNVQQELMPRVSLEVGYNRRWWSNFTTADNTLVGPADYQKWTIIAPKDSRLPNGGGYPVDIYTLTAAASAKGSFNYTTYEADFGPGRIQYWQGIDATLNARTRQGLTLQFGTSTGRKLTDTCATSLLIDSPDPRNCHNADPIETTLRGLASYMVPKVGVQVSATMRSQPPSLLSASYLVPNTVVQTLLGRLPPGGLPSGNTTVFLTDSSNRVYADTRRTQLDMRFAKLLKLQGRRLDIGVDLYNLLNTNYATAQVTQYDYTAANGGTWLNPTQILAPRFARVNLTFNF
jgi:hypothetical protein